MKKLLIFIMLVVPALIFAKGTLFDAAGNGDISFIKSYKGDINVVDKNGATALIFAAANDQTEAVKALIDAGANVNAADSSGRTALMRAASFGNTNEIKLLVDAKADVNALNRSSRDGFDTSI